MGMYLIYFIIIIFANTIGAISGMGGGVIIKPVFDTVAFHTLTEITFYSSVAVLTMSVASTIKQFKNGVKIKVKEAIAISFGSILGGVLGNKLFVYLQEFFNNEGAVQLIQIVLTVSSLLLVLGYTLLASKTCHFKSLSSYVLVGTFLGSFSTLLGIGGGPINVTLLIVCFGLSMKKATVYSIITIFFSQLAKLIEISLTTGFSNYDLSFLWVIIPAAIIGGYLGGYASGKVSNHLVSKIFVSVVFLVIVINLVNGWLILN